MKHQQSWFAFFVAAALFCFAVTGCGPKDSDIQQSVNTAIAQYPGITATVKDGVATLEGSVDNASSKDAIGDAAGKVKGVKSVVNNVQVNPPPAAVVISPDDALRTAVTNVIGTTYTGVQAAVADGVVTLTGTIKRSELQGLIQKINELHPKKVENKLTIN